MKRVRDRVVLDGIRGMSMFLLGVFFVVFMLVLDANGVIYISSIEELQKIGNDPGYPLNGEYELTGDIDASGTRNWNNGAGFKPIGSWQNPFVGKFDGKGYKISKLYIYRPSEDGVSLFSCVGGGGEVRNVKLEDVYVVGGGGVGGLVGGNYRGTIMQCYSTGSVEGYGGVGGLVGGNYGGTISECYSTGSVSGGGYVGGLVGENYGPISECYSTGSVSGGGYVGGLVGWNDNWLGIVEQSYWDVERSGLSWSAGGEGKTTAEMKRKATYVGWDFVNVWDIVEGETYPWLRVLGQTQERIPVERDISSLEELRKIGRDWEYPWDGRYRLVVDIDARETVNWNGGRGFEPIRVFTGVFDGNGHRIYGLYINRPGEDNVGLFGRNYGEVRNLGLEDVYVAGGRYVGGLVGWNGGTIMQCYSTGSVAGGRYVGGLVGWNYGGTISECYSTGSVEGGGRYVGGLVGENGGTISQCYSTGRVLGGGSVGGLVGCNWGTISECYSTGSVEGGDNVGGLVGCKEDDDGDGIVEQSYWNVETSGRRWSAGGEGKTTAEMKRKATYVGWDFVNVWDIVEGETYPWLRVLGPTQEPEGEIEGGSEGVVEGSTEGISEEEGGDGEGESGGDVIRMICGGCVGKAGGELGWWRYVLDFILVGMLVGVMSGMERRRG